ncbi:MAG: histidine kinase [Bacteroidales bacterium]|nr:histidine kinase [Bacteroidales bacterium]
MGLINKIVFNKYFISLILAISVILVLLLIANKYTAILISSEFTGSNITIYYHDLDYDGNSERIELHTYAERKVSLLVYKNDEIIDQWNYNGVFGHLASPFINDYDNDGLDEVFIFTQLKDSLYLNCVDVISKKVEFNMIPICKLYSINDEFVYTISPIDSYDVNADGIKEIFFSISTGFSTRPRNLFAYYPVENIVYISPESCALIINPYISDLDGDSIPEFFGSNMAAGNCRYEREYSDMYSWLMVFTPKMEFKFSPLAVGEYPSYTEYIPYCKNGENYILALHWYRGVKEISDYLAVFDANGSKIMSREIPSDEVSEQAFFFASDNSFNSVYLFTSSGEIYNVQEDLELKKTTKIEELLLIYPIQKDVDGDNRQEYIFTTKSRQRLIVLRSDFSHPVSIDLPHIPKAITVSIIENESASNIISIDTGNYYYTYRYCYTIVYRYWYLIFVFLYSIALAVIFMVHKMREYREIKISNTRKHLVELQLKSIQNQIDPHFTFNLLQSFASLLTEKDKERADYIFNKYAGMLKTTVLNGDKAFIPLQEELDFVASYLDLERFRQRDRFSYQINISDDIDTDLQIPKMLLHTFIENAIKHGLWHLESEGRLEIDAIKHNGIITLSITDNGVGREKASEYKSFSTGKGLKIMDQILDLYYLLFKTRIRYKIIDLTDQNNPIGTKIRITIPV